MDTAIWAKIVQLLFYLLLMAISVLNDMFGYNMCLNNLSKNYCKCDILYCTVMYM